ncbi:MAG TPA: hypothetical protein ENO18_07645 [Caldithrix sp.]|nr:hypothetical protein [Caldithrix sp.]
MQKCSIRCVIPILVLISYSILFAQDQEFESADSTITAPRSLIFIPADWENVKPDAVETEMADLLTNAAIDLDIMEVVDWLYADDVIYDESIEVTEQIDPSLALFIGEYGKIDHVYLFKVNAFFQEGRADRADDRTSADKLAAFFINLLDDEKTNIPEPHAKNIYTEIEIEFNLIDVRKAEMMRNFIIRAQFTGGRRFYSRTEAMDILYQRIQEELKRQYLSSFSIHNLEGGIKLSRNPDDQVINKGDLLEIFEPDQIEYVNGAEIRTSGESAAYCRVQEQTLKYYSTSLLRQWAPIDTNFVAREFTKHNYGFALEIPAPVSDAYYSFNLRLFYSPIQMWDWGGVFRIQRVEDSWNELNWGIGFGLFSSYKLFNISRFALKARLDADFDFFFKEDDYNESVTLVLGSLSPGLCAEFVFSQNTDIYFHAGYRFFGKSNNWQVSTDEDEPDIDAYWNEASPEMNISGTFVNIGFRFIFN